MSINALHTEITYRFVYHVPGTRVISVEVWEEGGEVVVRCVFRHTLSERCHVQLVSGEGGGFYQGGCVEDENEGSHRFTGLYSPTTYTVLVYGLPRAAETCSPSGGDPDYITVITLSGPNPTTDPSVTDDTTSMHTHIH